MDGCPTPSLAEDDVDEGEQEQPDHIHEMPVPGGGLEAEMLLGGQLTGQQAEQWLPGMKDKGFDSQIVSALANVAAADLQQAIATADAASKKSAPAVEPDAAE